MLELIDNLPGDTVGVSAHGELTAEDYRKVLAPAIEGALSQHDKINVLYWPAPSAKLAPDCHHHQPRLDQQHRATGQRADSRRGQSLRMGRTERCAELVGKLKVES